MPRSLGWIHVPFFLQEPVFFAGQEPQPEKLEKINEALGYLNLFLEGQNWVAGDSMTIADICLVVTVSNSEVSKSKSFCFSCKIYLLSKSLYNQLQISKLQEKLYRNIFFLPIMCENGGGGVLCFLLPKEHALEQEVTFICMFHLRIKWLNSNVICWSAYTKVLEEI